MGINRASTSIFPYDDPQSVVEVETSELETALINVEQWRENWADCIRVVSTSGVVYGYLKNDQAYLMRWFYDKVNRS